MLRFLIDLFLPIRCLGCSREGKFVCADCFDKIPLNQELPIKLKKENPLTGLIVSSNYKNDFIKELIHRYKYDFVQDLSFPLGRLMIKKINDCLEIDQKETILTPVPLHQKRLRWRGFNQAELLAQVISRELNIPLITGLLIRTKYRLPQVKIKGAQERKKNISQSFVLKMRAGKSQKEKGRTLKFHALDETRTALTKQGLPLSSLSDKTIILIDDISTTGATLEECALVLKPLRPKAIWGLVVARG